MKPEKCHWAGGVVIHNERTGQTSHMGSGYPACCTGDRAVKIAREGRQTWTREEVTCKACLLQLERADFTKRMHPDLKSFFSRK